MIKYATDPNGCLYSVVENIRTKERFTVCNSFNSQTYIFQQAVFKYGGVLGSLLYPVKALLAPQKVKPILMCETVINEEATEIVRILSSLFENNSVADIVTQYCSSATHQYGNDVIFFEKSKWLNRNN